MGVSDGPGQVATALGLLITQRSEVQILPPLPMCRSEALSEHGEGLLRVVCKPIRKRRARSNRDNALGAVVSRGDAIETGTSSWCGSTGLGVPNAARRTFCG
jgi:hypothetical protein